MTHSNQLLESALASADARHYGELCKRHGVAPTATPADLAKAFRRDAGSSVANFFRGDGVEYRESVADVARLLKVKDVDPDDVVSAEQAILTAVWNRYLDSLSEEERRNVGKVTEAEAKRIGRRRAAEAAAKSIASGVAGRAAVAAMGKRMFLRLLWKVVLPRLGLWSTARLAIAGPAALGGPVGLALLGATALYEVDKPALRKVVPTVLEVAVLRGCR